MKSLKSLFIAFLLLYISNSLKALEIKNDSILLVTDGKNISSLYDIKRNLQHVSDYANANGFFEISYINASNSQLVGTVKSTDFLSSQIILLSSGSEQAHYSYENNTIKVNVTINLNGSKAEVLWNINVELKNPLYNVSKVDFPRYRTSNDERKFVDPASEGRIFDMNTGSFSPFTKSYPGKQSIQMSACITNEGGAMLWTDDTKGHVKSFGYIKSGNYSTVSVHHLMPYESNSWQSSYNTHLTLCGNQWQDAAEIYRNWALQQSWSATPLRNRKDVPELLHQIPLVFTGQISLENLSTLPTTLKLWADMFGTRIIYEPTHWEKHYKYAGIDYFPVSIGNVPYKTLNDEFKEKGIVHAGCIESFHWTRSLDYDVVKTPNAVAQNILLEDFFLANNGANICRTKLDGSLDLLKVELRNEVFLCRGTDYGKTYLQKTAKTLFDLGITAIHNDYDQLMALDGACFNKNHGHPVPYGNWQIDVMKNVYAEITAEAKKRNITDFYLTKEYPNELFNMILHGNQVRNYEILNDSKIIPLYVYVYHDYISSLYGFGWMPGTANDDELAATLLYGQLPAMAFWQSTIKSPNQSGVLSGNAKTILADYFSAMKNRAKAYLFYGRLLKPLISTAPTTLIHNTWQDSIGNVGVFATNTLTTSASVAVKVPGTAKKYLNIFNGSTLVSSTEVNGGQNYNWEIPSWRLSYLIFSDNQLTATNHLVAKKKEITIYPNPVSNELNIGLDLDFTNWQVEILDMTGKTLIRRNNIQHLNLNNLQSGFYLLKVNFLNDVFLKKIIKN